MDRAGRRGSRTPLKIEIYRAANAVGLQRWPCRLHKLGMAVVVRSDGQQWIGDMSCTGKSWLADHKVSRTEGCK